MPPAYRVEGARSIDHIRNRREILRLLGGIIALPAFPATGCAQTNDPLRPEMFGATGGEDDTAAMQRLADQAAALGRWIDGNGRRYHVDNLVWPSGTRLRNISLRLRPGDRDDRSPVAIGRRGQITRDLAFENVTVDGNRAAQTAVGRSNYADGARSGFQIRGQVENVVLRDCVAMDCATDGVMIFSDLQHGSDDSYPLRNITLTGVTCHGNRRHGLSADGFRRLSINRCRFTDNGNDITPLTQADHGRMGARHDDVPYGRPFDIEDYLVGTGWSDLRIEDSNFRGNRTGALIYSPVHPDAPGFIPRHGLHITRCDFDEPGGNRWDPPLGIAQATDYRGSLPTFKDVTLIDNRIENAPLRISGVDGLIVRGGHANVTKVNETQSLLLTNCRNVTLGRNWA